VEIVTPNYTYINNYYQLTTSDTHVTPNDIYQTLAYILTLEDTPLNSPDVTVYTVRNLQEVGVLDDISILEYDSWQPLDKVSSAYFDTFTQGMDNFQLYANTYYPTGDLKQTINIVVYSNGYANITTNNYIVGISKEDITSDSDWVANEVYNTTVELMEVPVSVYKSLLEKFPLTEESLSTLMD
jgi:hypothetical protein